ncbi:ROK family protein [Haloferula sp. A504]|uniref:ROK family protein n=1 Tax=Haloferula sp. A504 TaxID=3373601 RepID=UPI0031CB4B30|nr:ROK family protein [Verrucomicrobiaceae bacterium E54]
MTSELAIGIDFGGTSVKSGVILGGEVIDTAPPIATQDFDGPDPLIDAMLDAVRSLRERHPGIAAVGVGMPGFVHFEQGVVHNLTNVPGWERFPLRDRLEQRLDLPVTVDNDANCMTYAEWKKGAGRGTRDLIAITLGTGVGGGVVANGQMIRGSRFGAGEVGQMSNDWQGKRGHYGNLGALEDYIGNREIAEMAQQHYARAGQPKTADEVTPQALSRLARAGDGIALGVWDEVARRLASTLMSCCWLLNPHALIIGGGVSRAGDLLFGPLTEHLYAQLSDPFRENLMVLPARFGNEAGMVGAGNLALEQAGYPVED